MRGLLQLSMPTIAMWLLLLEDMMMERMGNCWLVVAGGFDRRCSGSYSTPGRPMSSGELRRNTGVMVKTLTALPRRTLVASLTGALA